MHLVFVIAPGGGPEANVKTLAPEFEKRGNRISVIYTTAKEKTKSDWSASVRFRFAPAASAHYFAAKVVGSYRAWALRLRAREQARAVLRVLKEIENEEHIDVVEVTEGFCVSALGDRWPVVVRAHGSDWTFRDFCGEGEPENDRPLIAQQRTQFLRASCATALSAHLSRHLREKLRLPSVDVLPYGIDTNAFAPNSHSAKFPPVLLTVGRLERRKGVDVLLRAMRLVWQHFPDAQVRLVGNEGDLSRDDLLEMVPEDKRMQVVFPGFLERDQLIEEYQHATIYVAPTQYETFGYTVLEAMACGRPVISTRVGAIPELVENEVTGLLVTYGDDSALAEAIVTLVQNSASCEQMGERGRKKVIAHYSVGDVAGRTLALYHSVSTIGRV